MKKLIKFFCVVLIALSATLPAIAADGDDFTYEGITYTVISEADKTCETKNGPYSAGNNVVGDIVIPETVYNSSNVAYTVVKLGYFAFWCCYGLTSIDIPGSVTSIGNYAFDSCTSLTDINVAGDNSDYSSGDGILYNKNKTLLIQCPEEKRGGGDYTQHCGFNWKLCFLWLPPDQYRYTQHCDFNWRACFRFVHKLD